MERRAFIARLGGAATCLRCTPDRLQICYSHSVILALGVSPYETARVHIAAWRDGGKVALAAQAPSPHEGKIQRSSSKLACAHPTPQSSTVCNNSPLSKETEGSS
jgi:hypothetical protein